MGKEGIRLCRGKGRDRGGVNVGKEGIRIFGLAFGFFFLFLCHSLKRAALAVKFHCSRLLSHTDLLKS
jgi:hypothetical protein